MPAGDVFLEIVLVIGVCALFGIAALWLRQPLIVAFIVAGVAVGPAGFGFVTATDQVDVMAKIGISVLLFVVGLKLDPHLVKTVGPVALATGVGQVVFTSTVGFGIALALGLEVVPALYVAVALTFSSTIIIVKLLSDKREIDSLHGRIAVGFLIVQDVLVIVAMIGLNAFATAGGGEGLGKLGSVAALSLVFLLGVGAMAEWVLPRLLHMLARSQELLVLFAVAWALLLASAGELIGLSKEVGAFLAGVSIAPTAYREAIAARLVSLRDFLLLFFFIDLGSTIDMSTVGLQLAPALVLSMFVLIGNPLIVIVIMGAMGYRRRTGFLAGLTVAQISEFSLILAALGLSLGHIGNETLGLITVVGIITIGLSTYLIINSHWLYERLGRFLRVFERTHPFREELADTAGPASADLVVFGLGRFGGNIARRLTREGLTVLGVDFDPSAVRAWRAGGLHAQYGDVEDPELTSTLPLSRASWVVSTVPDPSAGKALLHALRSHGYQGRVALTAHDPEEAAGLEEAGADLVLLPFVDAAEEAADKLLARVAS